LKNNNDAEFTLVFNQISDSGAFHPFPTETTLKDTLPSGGLKLSTTFLRA